ncbi:hypothetical protein [Arthrobacter sp. Cr_A7]|uniref:hypothetical protein n=1 Tax=Arthrobacter sp. Cr_A7 TaxID=3031017 RepID=UPI0023DAEC19|nr:hypothetical protein [Arthrobacter sp. Cr_A7]MDF2052381.1 hypothetical protein [Arthrobacter sp. Cr_A7]
MSQLPGIEDRSVGFGFADMAYILQLESTRASETSASWLRLADETRDPGLVRAGLSSLIARGLATVAPDLTVSFDTRLDVVAYTVANAERWTQLDLLDSAETGDTVLHIESDKTKLLFQPRTMLAWFALPQDPDVAPEAAQSFVVREHLREHAHGGVRIRTLGSMGPAELLVRREDSHWICAPVHGDIVGKHVVAPDETALTGILSDLRVGEGIAANA